MRSLRGGQQSENDGESDGENDGESDGESDGENDCGSGDRARVTNFSGG